LLFKETLTDLDFDQRIIPPNTFGIAQMEAPVLLLVEDDPLMQEILSVEFADSGFEIVVVRDGTQAIAELDADATRFKAAVTDIKLGTGPDGWDVGRRARELVADMPIVYITGDSAHEWSSKGVPDSVVVLKPFAPAQLSTAVAALITAADTRRSG
jgi:DNA-binding response OmpR family regulator